MRIRVIALACGAALVLGFGAAPAQAGHCSSSRTGSETVHQSNPATNGFIYADGDGSSGGYVGVESADGSTYAEVKGDANTSSLYFHGASSAAGTEGGAGVKNGAPHADC